MVSTNPETGPAAGRVDVSIARAPDGSRLGAILRVPLIGCVADGLTAAMTGESRRERSMGLLSHAARMILLGFAAWFAVVVVLIAIFRFVNPPGSMLMLLQGITGTEITQTWVPINRISRNLIRAVVVSEDGRFCHHMGVDIQEVGKAFERAVDGSPRGASTISMQLSKNLFLWPTKSFLRKAIELPVTLVIEMLWPKRRILEVYLNIVEWGPGIFGAEAAARYHFNKSASRLTAREAALLAVALPNPVRRVAGDPGRLTNRLANLIQLRARRSGWAANCVFRKK
jgi:monofunctional biosynthetic peptidoglycan transglycosylase